MNLSQAKKRMQTIEKSLNEIKKSGFSIFTVDSDTLVLESDIKRSKNDKKHIKAVMNSGSAYGTSCWVEPTLNYDYVIIL